MLIHTHPILSTIKYHHEYHYTPLQSQLESDTPFILLEKTPFFTSLPFPLLIKISYVNKHVPITTSTTTAAITTTAPTPQDFNPGHYLLPPLNPPQADLHHRLALQPTLHPPASLPRLPPSPPPRGQNPPMEQVVPR